MIEISLCLRTSAKRSRRRTIDSTVGEGMKIESNDGEELAGIEENVSCRARFVARDDYVHHGCVSRTYTARTDTCPERVSVTLRLCHS